MSFNEDQESRVTLRRTMSGGNEFHEMLAELNGVALPAEEERLSQTIKRLSAEGRFGPPSPTGSTDAFLDESRKDLR